MNRPARIRVAVEDKPYPRGPAGQSTLLKVQDWLELSQALKSNLLLDIVPVRESSSARVDIVEAFSTRLNLLTSDTYPTLEEHNLVNLLPNYWPVIVRSGIPAIPIIKGEPDAFPVFVRGELGTFAGGGRVGSRSALNHLRSTGRNIVVRPYVNIRSAGKRKQVTLELRAHIISGGVAAVEYLFPPWASQKPVRAELEAGHSWTKSVVSEILQSAEKISAELSCRWFVADFAATDLGLRLVELNPGWCSGIAHPETARAVHLAILRTLFGIQIHPDLYSKPGAGVPFVQNI